MKKNIPLILTALVVILGLVIVMMVTHIRNIEHQLDYATLNNKAYEARMFNLAKSQHEFSLTIDQLRYTNDSIVNQLLEAKDELGIKDKNIRRLEHLSTTFTNTDTLYISDTVFVRDTYIDTTLGDEWMKTHLILNYPNEICVESTAKSSKDVIVHASRETIKPPKKFFLLRWFQKKHTVIKVDVIESNPHITSEDNVFIKVCD